MVRRIVIELETPGDSRTMFRLRIDDHPIADDLTAVQAHVLVGEIFARLTLPQSSGGAVTTAGSDVSMGSSSTPPPSPVRSRLQAIINTLFGQKDAAA
jgi:hypothetical protein